MKAILVDDSPQARKLLRLMLKELAPTVEVIAELEDATEGLRKVKLLQPDVVFLDIEMPGKSGLQMAEELLESGCTSAIVFTTAYNAYAINAFRLSAVDYLLKPIQEDQLEEAIKKLRQMKAQQDNQIKLEALTRNMREPQSKVLCVPTQGGNEYIPLDEIIFLEADGSYVRIVCTNGRDRIVSKNLKYFENALEDAPQFQRTHRSFLVNMDFLYFHSKSDGNLHLKNGSQIPISRERKQTVLSFLETLNKG